MTEPAARPTFRFAPSPNGRLHLGHAYSALLNAALARRLGGRLLLRIEDIDRQRARPELVAAIETDLAWLGLRFEGAPWRQSERFPAYAEALADLRARDLVYPCFCSRGRIAARVAALEAAGHPVPRDPDGTPLYPGTCRALIPAEAEARRAAGETPAWRLDMARALVEVPEPFQYRCIDMSMPGSLPLSLRAGRGPDAPCRASGERRRSRSEGEGALPEEAPPEPPPHPRLPPRSLPRQGGRELSPRKRGEGLAVGSVAGEVAFVEDVPADPARWGDVVLARRDAGTSYHLAVVVDDAAQGVTHVVRGQDLDAATDLHCLLQRLLGLPSPLYHHHALIRAADGEKLAKSRGSESLADLRNRGVLPGEVRARLGFA